jgi:uncharacterized protein (DUF488 family)
MKTSYFASKNISITDRTVAICRHVPDWYKGPVYLELAPTVTMLGEYKRKSITEEKFADQYTRHVLGNLNARTVYKELVAICGEGAVLLCYERPGAFCHRRLVAQWLQDNLSIKVPELGHEYPTLF